VYSDINKYAFKTYDIAIYILMHLKVTNRNNNMQTTFKIRISLHKIVAKKWQNHKDKSLVSSLQKIRKKLNECVFYVKNKP